MILQPSKFNRWVRKRLRQRGFLVHTHRDPSWFTAAPTLALPTTDPDLWLWVSSDTGISKDGSDHMNTAGCWTDRSGLAHDLDGAGASQATWLASQVNGKPGISFSGSYLSNPGATSSLAAPHTAYLLCSIPAWVSNTYLIDGTGGADGALIMFGSSPQLQQYGGNFGASVNLSFATWLILTSVWNGVSSSLEINNLGAATGNAGTSVPHRVVLGGYAGGGGANATYTLAACIVSNAANNSSIQSIHKNWLANYGGLSI